MVLQYWHFLAPEGRIQSLWPQLRRRSERQYGSVAEMDSERRCLCIEGGQQHLMIVSWGSLLDSMATRSGIKTNLGWNQRSGNCEVWPSLRTLVRSNPFARARNAGRVGTPQTSAQAPGRCGDRKRYRARMGEPEGTSRCPRGYGYGRYVRLHNHIVRFGVNIEQFEKTGETPLGVDWYSIARAY